MTDVLPSPFHSIGKDYSLQLLLFYNSWPHNDGQRVPSDRVYVDHDRLEFFPEALQVSRKIFDHVYFALIRPQAIEGTFAEKRLRDPRKAIYIVWKRETPALESSGNITSIRKDIARAVAPPLAHVCLGLRRLQSGSNIEYLLLHFCRKVGSGAVPLQHRLLRGRYPSISVSFDRK